MSLAVGCTKPTVDGAIGRLNAAPWTTNEHSFILKFWKQEVHLNVALRWVWQRPAVNPVSVSVWVRVLEASESQHTRKVSTSVEVVIVSFRKLNGFMTANRS